MTGPFGAGGYSPPPGGTPGFGAGGFGGGVVVHRARLLPRLLLVGFFMLVSFAVTGAIVWFSILGADDVELGSSRGTARSSEAADPDRGVSLPGTWPETLTPPADAVLVSAVASDAGTPEEQLVLVYELEQDAPGAADALRAQLTGAGLTITTDAIGPEGTGSLAAAGAGREANVAVGPTAARPGVVTVSWVLRVGPR